MITSFIIRYRDEGATPGEYETAASEHVGDSRKRLVVILVNASRLPITNRGKPASDHFPIHTKGDHRRPIFSWVIAIHPLG
jgi:hypothetical protein